MQNKLTEGSVIKNMLRFSLPYLLSCFLQTFYGLADLFITGQYNGAGAITAVSVGSQVTHMLTVIIVGLAMGATVTISRAVGARDRQGAEQTIGNTITIFAVFAVGATVILVLSVNGILSLLSTPTEAFAQARSYLIICFVGVPFITAYNVISSIFRGLGDSKSPMYFVAAAGVINVALDYVFIGPMALGAAGAALATVIAQGCSVLLALVWLRKKDMGVSLHRQDLRPTKNRLSIILRIGFPIALQDGFVQIAFLVITAIANGRGVDVAAAVGIVEKIIGFLFLVPSAMLSTVSAMAAQNAGAGLHQRGRQALGYGIVITVAMGLVFSLICQVWAEPIIALFAKESPEVVVMGGQYLRSYVFDCAFAGIHFCFSGYFCAYEKSILSFIHNLAAIIVVRIPGAYLASILYPDTLFPMGVAAPVGSAFSAVICLVMYLVLRRKKVF